MNSTGRSRRGKKTLLVRKTSITVEMADLHQADLLFFVDNPRVYSILRAGGEVPTQEEIYDKLHKMDHVKALIDDIRENGGLIDPVVVRDGTYEVIEGNSRLAAYRSLARDDPDKWAYIKCDLLPRDVDSKIVVALLGQYHIRGKKDWLPFEQAGFLYRQKKDRDIGYAELAKEIGLKKVAVQHFVETYAFMIQHNERDTSRWSYYDEYLKSGTIKKARNDHGELDGLVVDKIRNGEITRAEDVRSRLPVICRTPNVLKRFLNGRYGFMDAHEAAEDAGASDSSYRKLERFRQWLVRPETSSRLKRAEGQAARRIEFELGKIERQVKKILDKVKTR